MTHDPHPTAEEIHDLGEGFFEWSAFDPACKADLYSHAFLHDGKLALIDPIALTPSALEALTHIAPPSLVLLTNGNHERHTPWFREHFHIPTASSVHAIPELSTKPEIILEAQPTFYGLQIISLPGGGPGEVAFFDPASRTLLVGDALIHLDPKGLEILPDRYCANAPLLKQSLRPLLKLDIRRLLFAHGTPLTTQPLQALGTLLS